MGALPNWRLDQSHQQPADLKLGVSRLTKTAALPALPPALSLSLSLSLVFSLPPSSPCTHTHRDVLFSLLQHLPQGMISANHQTIGPVSCNITCAGFI